MGSGNSHLDTAVVAVVEVDLGNVHSALHTRGMMGSGPNAVKACECSGDAESDIRLTSPDLVNVVKSVDRGTSATDEL